MYVDRNIKKTSCPRGVLPEASWSGTGSAPAAGASRVLRTREAEGQFGRLPSSRPSEIRPPHTTTGPCHGTTRDRVDPACGEAEGLRTEIAGWDAGTPAFSKLKRAGALASRSPRRRLFSSPPSEPLSRTSSGRKDRESDDACDRAPRKQKPRRGGAFSTRSGRTSGLRPRSFHRYRSARAARSRGPRPSRCNSCPGWHWRASCAACR